MPGIRNRRKKTIRAPRELAIFSIFATCSSRNRAATNGRPSSRARKKLTAEPGKDAQDGQAGAQQRAEEVAPAICGTSPGSRTR